MKLSLHSTLLKIQLNDTSLESFSISTFTFHSAKDSISELEDGKLIVVYFTFHSAKDSISDLVSIQQIATDFTFHSAKDSIHD